MDQRILRPAVAKSASSKTTAGDFPPSSRVMGVLHSACRWCGARLKRGKNEQVLSSGARDDASDVSASGVEDVVELALEEIRHLVDSSVHDLVRRSVEVCRSLVSSNLGGLKETQSLQLGRRRVMSAATLADCSAGLVGGCEVVSFARSHVRARGRTLMIAGQPALMAPRRGPRSRTETRVSGVSSLA